MIEQVNILITNYILHDSVQRCLPMYGGGLHASPIPGTFPLLPLTVGYSGSPASDNHLPKAGAWMVSLKMGFALLIIFTASLLLVLVGHTDIPQLTKLMENSYAPEPQVPREPKWVAATALTSRVTEKSSEGKAPDFTLTSLDGSQVKLSNYKGKKGVVLVFFATWCVNCMKEVPEIKKFTLTAQKENIEVLAINFKQRKEVAEKFQKSNNINYRILLDADGAVTLEKYGIKGLPHIVGIDGRGEMIYRGEELPGRGTEFLERLQQGL